jgi:alanine racemase
MTDSHKEAWAEIHISDIEYNLGKVRERLKKGTKVCGILKADAYGHGILGIRKCLSEKHLVDMFAVGKMSELMLVAAGKHSDGISAILLGVANAFEVEECLKNKEIDPEKVIFSLYNLSQLQEFEKIGERLSIQIKVHIRMDGWNSGMGFGYDEYLENEEKLFDSEHIDVCGLYSHLYTSYSENRESVRQELERFDAFVKKIKKKYRKRLTIHVLNSALVFSFPEYAYDMVRVGTAMYGLPCGSAEELRPALRICARVFEVCDVDDSVPLSYDDKKKKSGSRRIARIMIGYWDNPLLLTQKKVKISINGRLYNPADDVCMDNLCIDVTGKGNVAVGDVAVLLGEDGVTIEEILARNKIQYVHSEWLCMTAGRLEKIYI